MFNCVSNPLSKIFNYLRHIHRGDWDSWASLVAQMVKNLPAMQETWAWFQGQENHLEKRRAFMELCSIKFPSLKCLLNKPTNKYMIIKKRERRAFNLSILAWRISWTEDPDGLQSMRLQRAGHEWVKDIRACMLGCSLVQSMKTHSVSPCGKHSISGILLTEGCFHL